MKEKEITKIKHFHPKGEKELNGSHFQKGGYFKECRDNLQKFDTACFCIVFPSNGLCCTPQGDLYKEFRYVGTVDFGHHFKGSYINNHGVIFNEESFAMTICKFKRLWYATKKYSFLKYAKDVSRRRRIDLLVYWAETKEVYSIIYNLQ